LLHEMSGIRLAESTVERATEDVGERIAGLLAEGTTFSPAVRWRWQRDARGRTVAYCTIDATGTRQQGPRGGKAEDRMAYVGSIYNPPPPDELPAPGPARPAAQARYVAGLYSLGLVSRPCGTPSCRCHHGGPKHDAYQLTFKDQGRSRSVYVPKDLVGEVRQWLAAQRRLDQLLHEIHQLSTAQIRTHVRHRRRRQGRT
jgi:hypothetical protein